MATQLLKRKPFMESTMLDPEAIPSYEPGAYVPQSPAPGEPPPPPGWTALDQLGEVNRQRPEIKRPGGWKGALQTAGEVALSYMYGPGAAETILHPKYRQQKAQWQRELEEANTAAGVENEAIKRRNEQQRIANDARRTAALEEYRGAQTSRERRLEDQVGKPPPLPAVVRPGEGVLNRDTNTYQVPVPAEARPTPERNPTRASLAAQAAAGSAEARKALEIMDSGRNRERTVGPVKMSETEVGNVARRIFDESRFDPANPEHTFENRRKWAAENLKFYMEDPRIAANVDRIRSAILGMRNSRFDPPKADGKLAAMGKDLGVTPGGPAAPPAAPRAPRSASPPPPPPLGGIKRPVTLMNTQTGEQRAFELDDEELADAKRQGFVVVR